MSAIRALTWRGDQIRSPKTERNPKLEARKHRAWRGSFGIRISGFLRISGFDIRISAEAFPVLLVIRNSKGEVRWMEVRDWLKRESDDGKKPVRQVVFAGERFDVMSVRR